MKRVGVVVVTYNRLPFLKDLIDSIRKQHYKTIEIICVNNSSTDGTEEWLLAQDDITTITQENCGGAGGFFTGLKYVAEHDFDYAWVMDDDVQVSADSLVNLIEKTQYANGFLCSKVVDSNGYPCNLPGISVKEQANGELCWNELSEKKLIRVDMASFVSVLIPIKIIKEIGLPLKEFFIWSDDTEYTTRISDKYPSYFVSDSIVTHRRIQNGILSIVTENDKRRVKMFFYFYRNYIYYVKKRTRNEKMVCFLRIQRDFFKCLIRLRLYKCFIILKAQILSVFFSPKIQYPNTAI